MIGQKSSTPLSKSSPYSPKRLTIGKLLLATLPTMLTPIIAIVLASRNGNGNSVAIIFSTEGKLISMKAFTICQRKFASTT